MTKHIIENASPLHVPAQHEIVNCDDVSRASTARKNYCLIKHSKAEQEKAKAWLLDYCPRGTVIQSVQSGYKGESKFYHFYSIVIPGSDQSNNAPYLHSLDIHLHIFFGWKLYTYGTTYGIPISGGDYNDIVRSLSNALYGDDRALLTRDYI